MERSSTPSSPFPLVRINDTGASATTLTADEPNTIDLLRQRATELAERDNIDKITALDIVQLFHEMERLVQSECTLRDREIARLTFELGTGRNEKDTSKRRR